MNDKIKKKLEVNTLFLLAFALFLLPFINTLTLAPDVILNTTSSNTSVTFSFNVSVRNVTIESNSIYLYWVIYTESGVDKFCPSINFSTPNSNTDSSEFKCPLTPSGGSGGGSGAVQTTTDKSLLSIELKPNYYYNSKKTLIYNNKTKFDGIAFEVIGKNLDEKNKILNLEIVNVSPQEVKNAFHSDIETLEVKESKILWTSDIITINKFNQTNISLLVGVEGILENLGTYLYSEGRLNINLNAPEKNANLLYSIGNEVWEGNPQGGILILLLVVIILGSINWRYKGIEKLNAWKERNKRKRKEDSERRLVALKRESFLN